MKKFEIIDRKIKLTDAEIESHMDFVSVLERSRAAKLNNQIVNRLSKRFLISLGLISLIGVTILSLKDSNETEKIKKQELLMSNKSIIESKKDKEVSQEKPEIVQMAETEKKSQNIKPLKNQEKNLIEKQNLQTKSNEALTEINNINDDQSTVNKGVILPKYNYQDAEPINGIINLYKYFEENIEYPIIALPDSVEGTVIVSFTIKEDGSIEKILIEKSLGTAFDEEAKRLISEMTKWNPATINSTPVSSKLSVPLHFKIK